jgi:hypothetical protein
MSDEKQKKPPIIYSAATGLPLEYGSKDPNILDPEEIPIMASPKTQLTEPLRQRSLYPLIPEACFTAEQFWLLPCAIYVAEHLVGGCDLIDERTYNKIQKELRAQNLFCVMNFAGHQIVDGKARWQAFQLICKNYVLVGFNLVVDLRDTNPQTHVGIESIDLWVKAAGKHVRVQKPGVMIPRNDAVMIVHNYFIKEGIKLKATGYLQHDPEL